MAPTMCAQLKARVTEESPTPTFISVQKLNYLKINLS